MKKRKLCLLLIFSFLLTGCAEISMTQTESAQISEYIAYSLLKFNNNPDMLITKNEEENKDSSEAVSQIKNEETEKAEASKNPTNQSNTEKPLEKTVTAGDVFGNEALSVKVSNSGLYDSYPKGDSYFALSASKGKKLLVIDLTIKNEGSKAVKFKTNSGGLSYSVNGSSDKALTTLLENDIHFFNKSIKPGKSVKAKLVYEVGKSYKLDTGKIQIANSNKSVELPIQ